MISQYTRGESRVYHTVCTCWSSVAMFFNAFITASGRWSLSMLEWMLILVNFSQSAHTTSYRDFLILSKGGEKNDRFIKCELLYRFHVKAS